MNQKFLREAREIVRLFHIESITNQDLAKSNLELRLGQKRGRIRDIVEHLLSVGGKND